jgi:hypothetical protein
VRWGYVWGFLCFVGAVASGVSAQSCNGRVGRGETCTGLQHFAYVNDWLLLAFLIVGFAGGALLGHLQDYAGGRSCRQCGRRVTNGVLDCPHCGFDFRSLERNAA